ncbi:MAG: glutamine-hydrolyzing carbamoyl-phosphate synthase small subunit [Syntrophomonadaceae bacterium]|nr:glutamine-hydrolyzing carbamoyl-phosphate synthase small subunit [Syntrophomonadaceae bacterium]
MKGYLVLENGRVFTGKMLNDCMMAGGEVVFTTAMISYQDIITDPSYYGQIVVMTYPLVGNVGLVEKSYASKGAMLRGLVLREATDFPSHYEMETDLISFLNKSEIAVLTEVDTRALTRVIRNEGSMGGMITDSIENRNWLIEKAKNAKKELEGDLVQYVTRKNIMCFGRGELRVVMVDLGTKRGYIDLLVKRGCEVVAVPAQTTAWEILELNPKGILISDGPGDPQAIGYAVETCRSLLGKKPIFGIGLGHQVLALALGLRIKRLPYGHRGSNHPVKDLDNGRIYITTQNHGFCIDEASLVNPDIQVTLRSVNDGSIEGIRHQSLPVCSVQFDPEGFPGYSETGFFLDDFVGMLKK